MLDVLNEDQCIEIQYHTCGSFRRSDIGAQLIKMQPLGIFMGGPFVNANLFKEARFRAAVEEYLVWLQARYDAAEAWYQQVKKAEKEGLPRPPTLNVRGIADIKHRDCSVCGTKGKT